MPERRQGVGFGHVQDVAVVVEGDHLERVAEAINQGAAKGRVSAPPAAAPRPRLAWRVMAERMAAEVTELAGPKGKHDRDRTAKRHGTEAGTVTLGGRRVAVRRARVRSVGEVEREVPLESYETFASTDLLTEGIVARMQQPTNSW